MTELSLKIIDKSNWEEAIQLSVKEEQKKFIASNLYTIAEVQFLDHFYVKGIYLQDKMIGLTMYGIDAYDYNYWIYRLMIDKHFQGSGLGRHAIKLIIEEIRQTNDANIPLIMIGCNPENTAAKHAYKKAGFVESHIAPWGEQLATFSL
ncbi:GNAT family N-acetyltransferase [Heyndrickxia acidicola]|uniref:GNAT family N-acetyltransferase n=1 Tax=Heyndrickxia acidicola TaxID=209389 RepID=A0ABU6MLZ9_9BACI|nr:GNAT family N-acetyltransferase [Heyndrickxia acidicola]MED1205714.1 GNAT family N-acetyltransferase [Heyndrickxia acidicola]